ncbi:MAG: methylmalonyl-CoA mutase [Desulfobacteraceae bacterium]|jgi:methylmalonyl-CoA mutase C-terminal domain/subunit|nr:methylmalonyl-CoA mutase [Desulfobacteraceae bacterium]
MSKSKRIIVGKMGLDSHDNGIRIIAKWLRDTGYEVIYAGLYNTADRMVQMAMEEDADAIGVSFLGGEHLFYADELIRLLKVQDMGHVRTLLGGVISPQDVGMLKEMGVDAVFTPGTMRDEILGRIDYLLTDSPSRRRE